MSNLLMHQRRDELDALFAALPPARSEDLDGELRGTLLGVRGVDHLPRRLSRAVYRLLGTSLNPWRGKSFQGGRGVNRWSVGAGELGHFVVQRAASLVDGEPTLSFDYDVPANASPLRRIRGEARRLGEGVILARMLWRGAGGPRGLLYFTLTERA
jgi:hypothetical protein